MADTLSPLGLISSSKMGKLVHSVLHSNKFKDLGLQTTYLCKVSSFLKTSTV